MRPDFWVHNPYLACIRETLPSGPAAGSSRLAGTSGIIGFCKEPARVDKKTQRHIGDLGTDEG